MTNPDGPRGAFIVDHQGGGEGNIQQYAVDSGTATAIYPGDAAKLMTDGNAAVMSTQSDDYIGIITAIYDTNKKPVNSLAASTAGYIDVDTDPGAILEIQTDDAGTALTAAAIGDATDFIWTHAGSGSRSGMELDESSLAGDGAAAQMRILKLVPKTGNAWGSHYARVRVVALEHAFNTTPNAI